MWQVRALFNRHEVPMRPPVAAIILAAGRGTRMKSDLPKVLHPVAGRPMLLHLLSSVDALAPAARVVVTGAGRPLVEKALAGTGAATVVQEPQLGTAHAVQQAQAALAGFEGDLLILYGDVPFVTTATMARMLDALARPLASGPAPACVVLGFRPEDTRAYGRIVADGSGTIAKMVEHKDASDEERRVTLCNSGLMAVRSADLWPLLARVGNDNAAGEYYLPDIVMHAAAGGRPSIVVETSEAEVTGINSRAELALAERAWQDVRRARAMEDGATLLDPSSVWFAHDTVVGRDVLIEPNVFFGPGVVVEDGVTIHGFSHIEGAHVRAGAAIGPYARLRPGADIGERARVGNFVELKQARLGAGAKANHLSYIGDAEVGERANVGAGTITCNYDGFSKHRTVIGADAFIGSNSALVAPVTVGDGAIVGAGSVVTRNIEPDALAVARGRQEARPGWAARFRARAQAKKKSG
jgi:bifunctional UDP-N-acetylglucosamine pyrophosphorylase/glucosamine-1-phosphate N-acetyltransferase